MQNEKLVINLVGLRLETLGNLIFLTDAYAKEPAKVRSYMEAARQQLEELTSHLQERYRSVH